MNLASESNETSAEHVNMGHAAWSTTTGDRPAMTAWHEVPDRSLLLASAADGVRTTQLRVPRPHREERHTMNASSHFTLDDCPPADCFSPSPAGRPITAPGWNTAPDQGAPNA